MSRAISPPTLRSPRGAWKYSASDAVILVTGTTQASALVTPLVTEGRRMASSLSRGIRAERMSEDMHTQRVRHALRCAPGVLDDEAVRSVEDINLARVREPAGGGAERPLTVCGVPGEEKVAASSLWSSLAVAVWLCVSAGKIAVLDRRKRIDGASAITRTLSTWSRSYDAKK